MNNRHVVQATYCHSSSVHAICSQHGVISLNCYDIVSSVIMGLMLPVGPGSRRNIVKGTGIVNPLPLFFYSL